MWMSSSSGRASRARASHESLPATISTLSCSKRAVMSRTALPAQTRASFMRASIPAPARSRPAITWRVRVSCRSGRMTSVFHYERNGAYVLAFSEEEAAVLEELLERGLENGVEGCRVISGEQARAAEPKLSAEVTAALDVPASAICDPYGLAFSAAENAAENGVHFVFRKRVTTVERVEGGADCSYRVVTEDGKTHTARCVVNAAGVFSDEINNMVSERKISIIPKRGNYCLYDPELGSTFERTMFQVPTARGKGVLVSPTVHGNLFIGPDSNLGNRKPTCRRQRMASIVFCSPRGVRGPRLRRGGHQQFRRLRASGDTGDFVIGEADDAPVLLQHRVLRVARPDLGACRGERIAQEVAARLGASRNAAFDPRRAWTRRFSL